MEHWPSLKVIKIIWFKIKKEQEANDFVQKLFDTENGDDLIKKEQYFVDFLI